MSQIMDRFIEGSAKTIAFAVGLAIPCVLTVVLVLSSGNCYAQQLIQTTYAYDDTSGLLDTEIVSNPLNSETLEEKDIEYAFNQYSPMADSNMYSEVYTVYRKMDNGGNWEKERTTWATFPIFSGNAYLKATQSQYSSSENAYVNTSTFGYDKFGNIDSVADSYGVTTSYIYGDSSSCVFATIKGADTSVSGYMGLEDGWQNWQDGGSVIDSGHSHTGLYSSYCNDSYGPTRNFYCSLGISGSQSYTLDAWVEPVSGVGYAKIEVRNGSDVEISSVTDTITTAGGTGWQHVSVTITPAQMTGLPSNGYLRVWCGFPDSTSNAGYVDDVRFFPVGAEMTTMTYDPSTLLLTSESDPDNNPTYYQYDGLGRLTAVKDDQGRTLDQYSYFYSREGNGDVYDSTDPNYTESREFRSTTDSTDQKQFFDGLGREIQDMTADGDSIIVASADTYDSLGRMSKTYRPFKIALVSGLKYDPSFDSDAGSYYAHYGLNGPSYSQTVYEDNPLNRVAEQGFPGTAWAVGSGNDVTYSYSDTSNNLYRYGTRDENHITKDIYKDIFGRTTQAVQDSGGLNLTTNFQYDMLGNLLVSIDPSQDTTNYTYNTLSQVTQKTSPDAGTVQYLYDRNGNLRFIKDANHTAASRTSEFIYRKYDSLNRMIEEGEYGTASSSGDFTQQNADNASFPTSNNTLWKTFHFDTPSSDTLAAGQRNLEGRLSWSESYRLDTLVSRTYYSYDDRGRVEWIIRDIAGTQPVKLTYKYDLQGNIVERGYEEL